MYTYTLIYIDMYLYIYIYTHIHTYIYTYIYTCTVPLDHHCFLLLGHHFGNALHTSKPFESLVPVDVETSGQVLNARPLFGAWIAETGCNDKKYSR